MHLRLLLDGNSPPARWARCYRNHGRPQGWIDGRDGTRSYSEHALAFETRVTGRGGGRSPVYLTFEFLRTGSICRATAVGLGIDEVNAPESAVCEGTPGSLEMPTETTMVAVQTYQTINHGVEDDDSALECGACHSALDGGPVRMDLQGKLGFGLRTGVSAVQGTRISGDLKGDLDRICSQCHDNERDERGFRDVHRRHVEDERKDCASCHNFSRPERNLRLTRDD